MAIIITFFILVGFAVFILAIILTVQFVRLGRELRQVGDDTRIMVALVERSTRTIQIAILLFAAGRGRVAEVYKKLRLRNKDKRGSV